MFMLCGSQIHSVESSEIQEKSPKNEKSEQNAVRYSIFGTLLPPIISIPLLTSNSKTHITYYNGRPSYDTESSDFKESLALGLLTSGILIGPGIGHLYANNRKAFFKGLAIRAVGGGVIYLGAENLELFSNNNNGSELLILGGVIVILVSMISDISKADNSVREYNKTKSFTQLNIYPSFKANEMRMIFAWSF